MPSGRARPGDRQARQVDAPDLLPLIARALPNGRADSHAVLADRARTVAMRPGDSIFRQGEPIPLTLVIAGYGAFRRTTVGGQQVVVGLANPGDLVGFGSAVALYTTVEMIALNAASMAMWPPGTLRRLVLDDAGIGLDVIDRMAEFLNVLTAKVDGFLHQDARQRVVRILVRHHALFFSEPAVLTRSHLPGLVGTSREMTGRVLRQLEREGLIARVGRNGLRLLEPDALELDASPTGHL
jgi:CRP-like cAMP-binding protein